MKMLNWVLPQTPVSVLDLSRVESILKRSLPEDLRTWLLKHNGAIPKPSELRLANGRMLDINSFISFSGNDKKENVFSLLDIYHDRLPAGLLPIAEDGIGNYVCLSYAEDIKAPRVVFWDHEEADPNLAIVPIASSFSDLIKRLEECDS